MNTHLYREKVLLKREQGGYSEDVELYRVKREQGGYSEDVELYRVLRESREVTQRMLNFTESTERAGRLLRGC